MKIKLRISDNPLESSDINYEIPTFWYKILVLFLSLRYTERFQNLGLFWGPQKQKKNYYNSTILLAKNKVRGNFWSKKLMDFLVFNKVFQNFIFSNY